MERVETHDRNGEERIRARQAAAERRVAVALRSIEEAQALLDQASQALCSVAGMLPEWQKVGKTADQVKAAWYSVDKKAKQRIRDGRLVLDHEPGDAEKQWTELLAGDQS